MSLGNLRKSLAALGRTYRRSSRVQSSPGLQFIEDFVEEEPEKPLDIGTWDDWLPSE